MKCLIIIALFSVAAADYGLHPDRPRWPRLPVGGKLPNDDSKIPPGDDSRVVGGHETTIDKYPYQVVLQRSGSFICGGSILDAWNVLTAAHCVSPYYDPDAYSVRSGATNRVTDGKVTIVSNFLRHEEYNSSTIDNDVAILHLSEALDLSISTQGSIPLANSGSYSGVACVVTGWGTTTEGGSTSINLVYGEVSVITNGLCQEQYAPSYTITDGMVCAWSWDEDWRVDACQGDSGGPLVAHVDGRQVGVVSWGIGCARPDYAGVYARVSEYYQWINENKQ